jgi:hypothetical protein
MFLAAVSKAIAELAEKYLTDNAAPTIEDYRAGNAWKVSPINGGGYRDDWQSLINEKCSGMEG